MVATVNPMGHALWGDGAPVAWWIFEDHRTYGDVVMNLVNEEAHVWNASLDLPFGGDYEIRVTAVTDDRLSATSYVCVSNDGPSPPWPAPSGHMHFLINCPYLWVWNGTSLEMRDNLICPLNGSFVDYYKLDGPVVANESGEYCFRLFESETKRDFFDYAGLVAVDHADNVEVGVDSNGTVMTYACPHVPSSVLYDYGYDVSSLVGGEDNVSCCLTDGHWFTISFAGLNVSACAKLVVRARSTSQSRLYLQRLNATRSWESVATICPRLSWSRTLVNVSACVPGFNSTSELRLVSVGACDVDFVGLDTSVEADCTVEQGTLVSVLDSRGVNATFGNLQCMDGVCAELRHNYDFDLRFSLSEFNGSQGMKRDFIFVSKAYYLEGEEAQMGGEQGRMLSGESMSSGSGLGSYICVDWMDWFNLIEDACRSRGWIWADVAGYDFYYFGNNEYTEVFGNLDFSYQPNQSHGDGLKQFLGKDVECDCSCDGHLANLGPIDEDRPGFYRIYRLDRFGDIKGWRPFVDSASLIKDTTLYVDTSPPKECTTVALLMNGTNSNPGIFIHSGLGPDESDYTKGYVAAALTIEEARAYVIQSHSPTPVYCNGNPHLATFSVSMVAGSEGHTFITGLGDHEFVDLLLTMNSYYEETIGTGFIVIDDHVYPYTYWFYSDIEDLELTRSGGNTLFDIDEKAGIDTIIAEDKLMEKIGWWGAGQTATLFLLIAGQTLGTPLPFAGLVGLIPIYLSTIAPPDSFTARSEHNWINGITVDTNNDYLCSSVIKCRMYFPSTPRDYSLDCKMSSWISYNTDLPGSTPIHRVQDLAYSGTLSFTVIA